MYALFAVVLKFSTFLDAFRHDFWEVGRPCLRIKQILMPLLEVETSLKSIYRVPVRPHTFS